MKKSSLRIGTLGLGVLLAAALFIPGTMAPLLANSQLAVSSITVVNNSGLTIHHLYISPPDQNEWSSDQLNDSMIGPGGSFTLSNVSCEGSIRVIGEDQDGCFLSAVVSCSGDSTWTIPANATRDCD
jgi:hypothetical protein